jgi:hypothetical protein
MSLENGQCLDVTKSVEINDSNLGFKLISKLERKCDEYYDNCCSHEDRFVEKYYLGLCSNVVTFQDNINLCCLLDGSSIILAIPLIFSVEGCYMYTLKPTLEEEICIKYSLDGNILNSIELRYNMTIANGYLYITIENPFAEQLATQPSIPCGAIGVISGGYGGGIGGGFDQQSFGFFYFSNFFIPVKKELIYCRDITCKPIMWKYGYPAVPTLCGTSTTTSTTSTTTTTELPPF